MPHENTPVSILVGEIEQRCVDLERLLQEIVATLNLEGNTKWYDKMPERWQGLVAQWTEQYRNLTTAIPNAANGAELSEPGLAQWHFPTKTAAE